MTHLHQVNSSKVNHSLKMSKIRCSSDLISPTVIHDKVLRESMLHYTAVGPLVRSVQRTELLESQEKLWGKKAAVASATPPLFYCKLQKVCNGQGCKADSPISWLDKLNNALKNWTCISSGVSLWCKESHLTSTFSNKHLSECLTCDSVSFILIVNTHGCNWKWCLGKINCAVS